jgi:hypothetical protein
MRSDVSINPKVLFANNNNFEESLCLLFPKHIRFFSLNTASCEIFKYKKDSKYNVLNWVDEIDWPNDNTNEFLTYEIHEESHNDFIDRYNYGFPEGFLYADLRRNEENTTNFSLNDILNKLLNSTHNPTLITYSSKMDLTHKELAAINKWSIQNYIIIDPNTSEVVNVLTNYDIKRTSVGSVGINASERQRITRKSLRWQSGFNRLPSKEQDYILMNLIGIYLQDK